MENPKYQSQYRWKNNHPEKIKKYRKKYRKNHREKIRQYQKKYHESGYWQEYKRKYKLIHQKNWKTERTCKKCGKKYIPNRANQKYCGKGCQRKTIIIQEEYQRLLKKQKYQCAICGGRIKLCVDHDHKTGKVRGLLCNCCNVALGMVRDNSKILREMIKYLKADYN